MNYSNAGQSTLAADITAVATTLTVATAVPFPAAPFHIVVDAEIMTVTAVVGNAFTVTRGIEGTSATTHSAGAMVTNCVTAADYASFGAGGVTSFNARTGAITLTSTDVFGVLAAGTNITLTDSGGHVTIDASGGVTSFNTRTGAVALTSTDIFNLLSTANSITITNVGGFVRIGNTAVVTSFNSRQNAVTLTSTDVFGVLAAGTNVTLTNSGGHVTIDAAVGVASFNTRTGAVTLTSADVTTALGLCAAWMKRTTSQTITDNLVTQVAFNSAVVDTTGSQCNTATGAVTVANTGKYVVTLNLIWNNLHAAGRVVGQIYVNGVQQLGNVVIGANATQVSCSCAIQLNLTAGDVVTADAYNNTGSSEVLIANLQSIQVTQLAGF